MDCSLLGETVFYPFKHSYTLRPTIFNRDPVNVADEDVWLLKHCPSLVLTQFRGRYVPDATSAVRLFNNCSFRADGCIACLSPALVRAHALAYVASLHDVKTSDVQRVYITKREPGPLRACKSRYRPKRDRKWIEAPKAGWRCQGKYHTKHVKDNSCEIIDRIFRAKICTYCRYQEFYSPRSGWIKPPILDTYLDKAFSKATLKPLLDKPLARSLQGAVFMDSTLFNGWSSEGVLKTLEDIADIIYTNPILMLLLNTSKETRQTRRKWGQVLSYEQFLELNEFFTSALHCRPIAPITNGIRNILCLGFYHSMNHIRTWDNTGFLGQIHPKVDGHFSTKLPNALLMYTNTKLDGTWVFEKTCIQALYKICSTRKDIKIKLTGFYECVKRPSESVHPHDLQGLDVSKQSSVCVFPAEFMTWADVCYLLDQQSLLTIRLVGNYSYAAYGIQTAVKDYSIGGCFSQLVDFLHTPLDAKKLVFPCNFIRENLDLTHSSRQPGDAIRTLERTEAFHWTSGAILRRTPVSWPPENTNALVEAAIKECPRLRSRLVSHPMQTGGMRILSTDLQKSLTYFRQLVHTAESKERSQSF